MRAILTTIALTALLGCNAANNPSAPTAPPSLEDRWQPEPTTEQPSGTLTPGPQDEGRDARRMSVDQLRRTIPALFDGITWTIQINQNTEVEGFTALSRTLGEPDYVEVTSANNEPSPLFAKYMDDMAGNVCEKAVQRDLAGTEPKLVIVHEDVDENLRFLRLKLHGVHAPEGSSDESLRALYDEVLTETGQEGAAHYAVCVAMLTAPEFMAY